MIYAKKRNTVSLLILLFMKLENLSKIILFIIFILVSYFHLEIVAPILLSVFLYLFFSFLGEKIFDRFQVFNWFVRSLLLFWIFFISLFISGVVAWNFIWENFSLLFSELEWWYSQIKNTFLEYVPQITNTSLLENLTDDEQFVSLSNLERVIWWTYDSLEFLLLTVIMTVILLWFEKRIIFSLKMIIPKIHTYITLSKKVISKYILWISIMTLIISAFYFVWLMIFWVKYSLIIAVCAGIAAFIPTVWTLFWWILAIFATWILTWEVSTTIGITIWIVCVQTIEEYYILPKVVGDKVALNPYVTLLWVIWFWYVRGILWIFLSTPLLWILMELWKEQKSWYYYLLGKQSLD